MIRNVILAGVGGQGLLTLAAIIGEAALSLGLHLKQSEVHGMAQRGGAVQSHLRYGDRPIHSDLIWEGTADLILALEPMEALRYLPFLSPNGIVVSNRAPFVNIPDYPEESTIHREIEALPRHRLIDAVALAKQAGSERCANMVILGAGSPFLSLPEPALLDGIRTVFASKPASVVETNIVGFRLGRAAASKPEVN